VMTLAYDAGRDAFWAIGGDGRSMYLLQKSGLASLVFTVSDADRPGFQPVGAYPNEIKVAYDATDDTLWYSSDAGTRIYHYHTYADAQGTAVLVTETPYIDVNIEPNDMSTECGYSQSSGVAVGGADLFVTISGCSILFEFTNAHTGADSAATADTDANSSAYADPAPQTGPDTNASAAADTNAHPPGAPAGPDPSARSLAAGSAHASQRGGPGGRISGGKGAL